jgi:hypothetical protein
MSVKNPSGKPLPGGFPQFKRHLAAIHRMPPMHAPVRGFHASDVIYAMLRHGVGRSMIRNAGNAPMQDSLTAQKAVRGGPKSPKKLTSNSLFGSILRKPL